jgi:hypothetical protein
MLMKRSILKKKRRRGVNLSFIARTADLLFSSPDSSLLFRAEFVTGM